MANGQYFRFDLYSELVDTTNGITLPDGTYTLDGNDTCAPGTFGFYYSLYYAVDEYGYDYSAMAISAQPAKKSVVKRVNYDKVKIEAKSNAKNIALYIR